MSLIIERWPDDNSQEYYAFAEPGRAEFGRALIIHKGWKRRAVYGVVLAVVVFGLFTYFWIEALK